MCNISIESNEIMFILKNVRSSVKVMRVSFLVDKGGREILVLKTILNRPVQAMQSINETDVVLRAHVCASGNKRAHSVTSFVSFYSHGGGGQVSIALGSKCAEFSSAMVAKWRSNAADVEAEEEEEE